MTTDATVGGAKKICFVTSLTEYAESDLEGVGTTREDQYGRKFRWVKNASDNAARLGGVACFDASNLTTSKFLQECTTEDIAAGDVPYFAGLWMSAVPGGCYGWIITNGVYDTARVGMNSGGTDLAAGGLLVPNVSTDTTGTGTAVVYALIDGEVISTLGADTALTPSAVQLAARRPHCVVMEACGTGTSDTVGLTLSVFVKGLI